MLSLHERLEKKLRFLCLFCMPLQGTLTLSVSINRWQNSRRDKFLISFGCALSRVINLAEDVGCCGPLSGKVSSVSLQSHPLRSAHLPAQEKRSLQISPLLKSFYCAQAMAWHR